MNAHKLTFASGLILLLMAPGRSWSQEEPLNLSSVQAASHPNNGFENFVTRSGDKLFDGEDEYRFFSVNMVETFVVFTNRDMYANSWWRLPDDYELEAMVKTVRDMGGQCFRGWLLTCRKSTEWGDFSHIVINTTTNTLTYNEQSFERVDKLLQLCNQYGVRMIFVCGDNWDRNWGYWGDYGSDFFTVGSQGETNYKKMLTWLLNRVNTHTGIKYKYDKAILGWEPFNELWKDTGGKGKGVNDAWMSSIAAHVKSIDTNHLFIDGRLRPTDFYPDYTLLDDPNIDVVQANYYTMMTSNMADDTKIMRNFTRGKKPYIVGEIPPYMTFDQIKALLDEVKDDGSSGAMMWCAKYPNREGGWYFQNNFNMHWPGFRESHPHYTVQDEAKITDLLAEYAYGIQGKDRPPLAVPGPTVLLPIPDPGHISWQTSLGARSYRVFRASNPEGPWTFIGTGYDNLVVSNHLFYDPVSVPGESYYYRVTAVNESGESAPSNIIGPVSCKEGWLVDNLNDSSLLHGLEGTEIDFLYILPREQDGTVIQHLMRGDHGILRRSGGLEGAVVYAPDSCGAISSLKIWAYQPSGTIHFLLSADGMQYDNITVPQRVNNGGNKIFELDLEGNSYRYFKILLDGNEDINSPALSRVEIGYQFESTTPETNSPPTISITSPEDNSTHYLNQDIWFSADVFDNEDDSVKVEFLVNGFLVGSFYSPPYEVLIPRMSYGKFRFEAWATDSFGFSVSDTVNIVVLNETDPTGEPETEAIEGPIFSVLANPVRDGHLSIRSENYSRKHITLINSLGQIVFERTVIGPGRFEFALPSPASGLYLLRVDEGWSSETRKLIYWD